METTEIEKEILRHLIAHGHRINNPASIDETCGHLMHVFGISKDDFNEAKEELLKDVKKIDANQDVMWFTGAGKKYFEESNKPPIIDQGNIAEKKTFTWTVYVTILTSLGIIVAIVTCILTLRHGQ